MSLALAYPEAEIIGLPGVGRMRRLEPFPAVMSLCFATVIRGILLPAARSQRASISC